MFASEIMILPLKVCYNRFMVMLISTYIEFIQTHCTYLLHNKLVVYLYLSLYNLFKLTMSYADTFMLSMHIF